MNLRPSLHPYPSPMQSVRHQELWPPEGCHSSRFSLGSRDYSGFLTGGCHCSCRRSFGPRTVAGRRPGTSACRATCCGGATLTLGAQTWTRPSGGGRGGGRARRRPQEHLRTWKYDILRTEGGGQSRRPSPRTRKYRHLRRMCLRTGGCRSLATSATTAAELSLLSTWGRFGCRRQMTSRYYWNQQSTPGE
jgi:hypothetical protein